MQIINCLKLSNWFNIGSGIIADKLVEDEVEGSSKWTDRALMLQSGLLTALEVEEEEHGKWIRRIRAR